MSKAYDVKELVEILKVNGLDLAEEAAELAVKSVLEWVEKSADLSENKYDDLLKAVIPMVKPMLLKGLDKIDGKVD